MRACADGTEQLRLLLSQQLQRHVLDAATATGNGPALGSEPGASGGGGGRGGGTSLEAAHCVLSCLDHLRCMRLDAMAPAATAGGGKSKSKAKTAASGLSGCVCARSAPSPRQFSCTVVSATYMQPLAFLCSCPSQTHTHTHRIHSWPTVYWLDLGYLPVASCALRCGSPFTALQYAEEAIKQVQGGRLMLATDISTTASAIGGDGGNTHGEGALPPLEQLLLDVYSAIAEPDSIYAVARRPALRPQLQRQLHEGNWMAAMCGLDALLAAAGGNGGPGSGAPSSGVVGVALGGGQQGVQQRQLMHSLQQLGCRHLTGVYWQHVQREAHEQLVRAHFFIWGIWSPSNPQRK